MARVRYVFASWFLVHHDWMRVRQRYHRYPHHYGFPNPDAALDFIMRCYIANFPSDVYRAMTDESQDAELRRRHPETFFLGGYAIRQVSLVVSTPGPHDKTSDGTPHRTYFTGSNIAVIQKLT